MFKPRLRISRTSGPLRACQPSAPTTTCSPSPFVAAQKHQQRSIHATPVRRQLEVPKAPEVWKEKGIDRLLSEGGYDIAWSNYQAWLIEELNKQIGGTTLGDDKTAKDIAIQTSREPGQASIFNLASMAHNNEFFFSGIAVNPTENPSQLVMPQELRNDLTESFGSIDSLEREMINSANAMFGPGFTWLVRLRDVIGNTPQYRVLNTYLAGSPYPGAHWRRQEVDMNSVAGVTDESGQRARQYFDQQNIANKRRPLHGFASRQDQEDKSAPGGANLIPVLCVNTWSHVWLPDYGFGGKFDFLVNWWRLVNWSKVWERANPIMEERTVSQTLDFSNMKKVQAKQ